MTASATPNLTICSEDADRLARLLEARADSDNVVIEQLEDELVRANIVPIEQLPTDVVRIGSSVRYQIDGVERDVTLVWPHEASLDDGKISVLSPVGAALLGLTPGQRIAWPLPGDRMAELHVVTVGQA